MEAFRDLGIPDHLTCLLRNLYAGQEATVNMEKLTGSRLRKEYDRAVCCHPAGLPIPLSMEFSKQEYWSGLPLPSPGDLPNPGIEPRSPALQADSLPSEPPGKPPLTYEYYLKP